MYLVGGGGPMDIVLSGSGRLVHGLLYDKEYEELYKDVNVRLTYIEHEEQGKEDEEITDAGRDDSTQQTKYEQVKDDEHVTLTTVHDTQKTEGTMQSSYVSFDFANQSVQGQKLEHIDSARSRPSLQGLSLGVVSTPYCRAAKLTLVH
ncbi:hypothetical protein Tco_1211515 [Tanacetum coccineum]